MTFQDFIHKHIMFVVYLSALLGLLDPKFGVNLSSEATGNNMRPLLSKKSLNFGRLTLYLTKTSGPSCSKLLA